MQNTSSGNVSKQLHNVADSARQTAEQTVSDLGNKASQMAHDAKETAGEYYDKAQNWVQSNSKTLSAVGLAAATGVIGYMIGRSNSKSQEETKKSA